MHFTDTTLYVFAKTNCFPEMFDTNIAILQDRTHPWKANKKFCSVFCLYKLPSETCSPLWSHEMLSTSFFNDSASHLWKSKAWFKKTARLGRGLLKLLKFPAVGLFWLSCWVKFKTPWVYEICILPASGSALEWLLIQLSSFGQLFCRVVFSR